MVSQRHGLVEVVSVDGLGDLLGVSDGVHERLAHDLVLGDSDEAGLGLGRGLEDRLDGLDALQSGQHAVVCHRRASALDVAQRRNARVDGQSVLVGQEGLQHFTGNLSSMFILGTFCDNDDGLALAQFPVLCPG